MIERLGLPERLALSMTNAICLSGCTALQLPHELCKLDFWIHEHVYVVRHDHIFVQHVVSALVRSALDFFADTPRYACIVQPQGAGCCAVVRSIEFAKLFSSSDFGIFAPRDAASGVSAMQSPGHKNRYASRDDMGQVSTIGMGRHGAIDSTSHGRGAIRRSTGSARISDQ
jgi:hypothetical protein